MHALEKTKTFKLTKYVDTLSLKNQSQDFKTQVELQQNLWPQAEVYSQSTREENQ